MAVSLVNIDQKLLECPVCLNIEPGRMHNCESGHSICQICRTKIISCPSCCKPFANSRNYALESLIDSSLSNEEIRIGKDHKVTYCPFKADGCGCSTQTQTLSKLQLHAQTCEFRYVYCGLDSKAECFQKPINYRDYFEHLKQKHQIVGVDEYIGPIIKTDACDIKDRNIKYKPFYIVIEDIIFFRRCEIMDGIIYWWVTVMGNEQLASKYKTTIASYVDDSDSNMVSSFKFRLPVHPFRRQCKEVLQSGQFACISTSQLPVYSQSSVGLMKTKISISRMYGNIQNFVLP